MDYCMKNIVLDFEGLVLEAELFDNSIAEKLYNSLPLEISLTHWGDEMYGSIGKDLGEDKPQASIPPGGIAYTSQGTYLCVFYGQNPAWPVEFIGQLNPGWEGNLHSAYRTLKISKK
jgi:hypothetical protein